MKRLILFALLLATAILAATGCDLFKPAIHPESTTAEPTVTTTDGVVTTTEAETTTAATTTTAPVTTTEGPWLLEDDMSLYIDINAALYKEVALKLPAVAEITMTDVERYLFSKRATSTLLPANGPVQYGDTVSLYYRGEVNMGTKDEPVWVEFLGGNNFTSDPHSLGIGSGSFIPGFEDALIGLDPAETSITQAADGTVLYITYTFSYTDASGTLKTSAMVDRVDLTKDGEGGYTAACRYGDAFRDAVAALAVNDYLMDGESRATLTLDFDVTGDLVNETVTMTDITVYKRTNELTKSFTISFPTNYTEPLAGREARWQVVIAGVKRPVLLDLDYTLISETIGITYAAILANNELFGLLSADEIATIGEDAEKQKAAVMALYEQYIFRVFEENRRADIEESLWEAFSEYIVDALTVKGYPEYAKAEYLSTLYTQAQSAYAQYATQFSSFEAFLAAYYGEEYFPEGTSTDEGFAKLAEVQLRYEMMVYYIAAAEGLDMDEAKREAYAAEEMQRVIDYYNDYYAQYGITFTEEDLVKEGITRRLLVENAYFTAVKELVADTLYDLIVFE